MSFLVPISLLLLIVINTLTSTLAWRHPLASDVRQWCQQVFEPRWPFAYEKYVGDGGWEWKGRTASNLQNFEHVCNIRGADSKCHICETIACGTNLNETCEFQIQGIDWDNLPKNIPTVSDTVFAVGPNVLHRNDFENAERVCLIQSRGECIGQETDPGNPYDYTSLTTLSFQKCSVRCWGVYDNVIGPSAPLYYGQEDTVVGTSGSPIPIPGFTHPVQSDKGWNYSKEIGLPQGRVFTVTGKPFERADYLGGSKDLAKYANPQGIALDIDRNIYIADTENHIIRKIDVVTHEVTTLAGQRFPGFRDGSVAVALFSHPTGITVHDPCASGPVSDDPADCVRSVIVADTGNHRIRSINLVTGVVSTIAGGGGAAFDDPEAIVHGYRDGFGVDALFHSPVDVVSDENGNIFVADYRNHLIRWIEGVAGYPVRTLAGTVRQSLAERPGCASPCLEGVAGYRDGRSDLAELYFPTAVDLGPGNPYSVVFTDRDRLRMVIDPTVTPITESAVLGGLGFSRSANLVEISSLTHVITLTGGLEDGDRDGPSTDAKLDKPRGLAVSSDGHIFVSDSSRCRIRRVSYSQLLAAQLQCVDRLEDVVRPAGCWSYEPASDAHDRRVTPMRGHIIDHYFDENDGHFAKLEAWQRLAERQGALRLRWALAHAAAVFNTTYGIDAGGVPTPVTPPPFFLRFLPGLHGNGSALRWNPRGDGRAPPGLEALLALDHRSANLYGNNSYLLPSGGRRLVFPGSPFNVTSRHVRSPLRPWQQSLDGRSTDFCRGSAPPDRGLQANGLTAGPRAGTFAEPLDVDENADQGARYLFRCPAECASAAAGGAFAGARGSPTPRVFGSGPYASGSSICLAAQHAGVLDPTTGGVIVVRVLPHLGGLAGKLSQGLSVPDVLLLLDSITALYENAIRGLGTLDATGSAAQYYAFAAETLLLELPATLQAALAGSSNFGVDSEPVFDPTLTGGAFSPFAPFLSGARGAPAGQFFTVESLAAPGALLSTELETVAGAPAADLDASCGHEDAQPPSYARMRSPAGLALRPGSAVTDTEPLFVADAGNNAVRAVTAFCSSACENGGRCVRSNVCACTPGWAGHDCTIPLCPAVQPAFEGSRTLTNPLTGLPELVDVRGDQFHAYSWFGITDLFSDPQACPAGRICTAPGVCSCPPGWGGVDCTVPLCVQECAHGTCVAPDTCGCEPGWFDSRCSTPVCSQTCGNGGNCTAPDTCTCPSMWTGADCRTPVCSQGCNGESTNLTDAHGVPWTLLGPGLGGLQPLDGGAVRGHCVAPDTCRCERGWAGHDCGRPVCEQGFFRTVDDAHVRSWMDAGVVPFQPPQPPAHLQFLPCRYAEWCASTNEFECFQKDRVVRRIVLPGWRNVTGFKLPIYGEKADQGIEDLLYDLEWLRQDAREADRNQDLRHTEWGRFIDCNLPPDQIFDWMFVSNYSSIILPHPPPSWFAGKCEAVLADPLNVDKILYVPPEVLFEQLSYFFNATYDWYDHRFESIYGLFLTDVEKKLLLMSIDQLMHPEREERIKKLWTAFEDPYIVPAHFPTTIAANLSDVVEPFDWAAETTARPLLMNLTKGDLAVAAHTVHSVLRAINTIRYDPLQDSTILDILGGMETGCVPLELDDTPAQPTFFQYETELAQLTQQMRLQRVRAFGWGPNATHREYSSSDVSDADRTIALAQYANVTHGVYACANGGICTGVNECRCAPGWIGFDCRIPICTQGFYYHLQESEEYPGQGTYVGSPRRLTIWESPDTPNEKFRHYIHNQPNFRSIARDMDPQLMFDVTHTFVFGPGNDNPPAYNVYEGWRLYGWWERNPNQFWRHGAFTSTYNRTCMEESVLNITHIPLFLHLLNASLHLAEHQSVMDYPRTERWLHDQNNRTYWLDSIIGHKRYFHETNYSTADRLVDPSQYQHVFDPYIGSKPLPNERERLEGMYHVRDPADYAILLEEVRQNHSQRIFGVSVPLDDVAAGDTTLRLPVAAGFSIQLNTTAPNLMARLGGLERLLNFSFVRGAAADMIQYGPAFPADDQDHYVSDGRGIFSIFDFGRALISESYSLLFALSNESTWGGQDYVPPAPPTPTPVPELVPLTPLETPTPQPNRTLHWFGEDRKLFDSRSMLGGHPVPPPKLSVTASGSLVLAVPGVGSITLHALSKTMDVRSGRTHAPVDDTRAAYAPRSEADEFRVFSVGRWRERGGECTDEVLLGCFNDGVCVGPNKCRCAPGWEGDDCSLPICTHTTEEVVWVDPDDSLAKERAPYTVVTREYPLRAVLAPLRQNITKHQNATVIASIIANNHTISFYDTLLPTASEHYNLTEVRQWLLLASARPDEAQDLWDAQNARGAFGNRTLEEAAELSLYGDLLRSFLSPADAQNYELLSILAEQPLIDVYKAMGNEHLLALAHLNVTHPGIFPWPPRPTLAARAIAHALLRSSQAVRRVREFPFHSITAFMHALNFTSKWDSTAPTAPPPAVASFETWFKPFHPPGANYSLSEPYLRAWENETALMHVYTVNSQVFDEEAYFRQKYADLRVSPIKAENFSVASFLEFLDFEPPPPPMELTFRISYDVAFRRCANGGNCTAPDTCTCQAGWSGPDCRTPLCIQECFNGGFCSAPDSCTCRQFPSVFVDKRGIPRFQKPNGEPQSTGWTGFDCNTPICTQAHTWLLNDDTGSRNVFLLPDGNPIDGEPLPNDGTVFQAGCAGDGPYLPLTERTRVSPTLCGQANWWMGAFTGYLEGADENTRMAAGRTVRVNHPNYVFDEESQRWLQAQEIPGEGMYACYNLGACVAPDKCECAVGWTGYDCNVPMCSFRNSLGQMVPGCRNGGICVDVDTCSCPTSPSLLHLVLPQPDSLEIGWAGNDCAMAVCTQGWFDPDCRDVPVSTNPLYSAYWDDEIGPVSVSHLGRGCYRCANNGNCTAPDTCTCAEGWTGYSCEQPVCLLHATHEIIAELDTVDQAVIDAFEYDPCGTNVKVEWNGREYSAGNCSAPNQCTCLCKERAWRAADGSLVGGPWKDPLKRGIPVGYIFGRFECIDGFEGNLNPDGSFSSCHLKIYVPTWLERHSLLLLVLGLLLLCLLLLGYFFLRRKLRKRALLLQKEKRRERRQGEEQRFKQETGTEGGNDAGFGKNLKKRVKLRKAGAFEHN